MKKIINKKNNCNWIKRSIKQFKMKMILKTIKIMKLIEPVRLIKYQKKI